jgi:hypothetical protein
MVDNEAIHMELSTLLFHYHFVRSCCHRDPELSIQDVEIKYQNLPRRLAKSISSGTERIKTDDLKKGSYAENKARKSSNLVKGGFKKRRKRVNVNVPSKKGAKISDTTERTAPSEEAMDMYHLQSMVAQTVNTFPHITECKIHDVVKTQYIIKEKCERLYKILAEAKGKGLYRGDVSFKVNWMQQFGHTANTRGLHNLPFQHPFNKNFATNDFKFEELPVWKKEVFQIGIALYEMKYPEGLGMGTVAITLSHMTPSSTVGWHQDPRDISPQLLVSVGKFKGGNIRMFSEDNKYFLDLSTHCNPTICDGRLDHYVHPITEGE